LIELPYAAAMKIDHPAGTALVLAGLLGALVGCGGGEQPEPAAAPSTPAAAPAEPADATKPCTLLSGEAVGKVFGTKPATPNPQPTQRLPNGLDARSCQYRSTVGSIGVLNVTVTDGRFTAAQVTDAIRQKMPSARPVPGVGESAVFYLDEQNNGAMVAASKAWHGQTIMVSCFGSRRASQEQLATLVKQAIDAA
jgi:hypothetical protein